MNEYLLIFFRIITIMSLLLFCTLIIMGKRPIGELPVFDFLSIIVIGAIVGADIADPKIEHLPTAFAVVIVSLLQRVISGISIKNKRFRKMINFEPTIVVVNGKIIHKNVKKIKYSIDEILMLLREKDIFDLNKVSYAIIEPNGSVSILIKSKDETVTLKHMNLVAPKNNIFFTVVLDGKLQREGIKRLNISEDTVMQALNLQGYDEVEEIFFADMDRDGNINISPYNAIEHYKN